MSEKRELTLFRDENGFLRMWAWGTAFITGLLVMIAGIVAAVTMATQHSNRVDCRKWGASTGRVVKFDDYGFWDLGHCFTRDASGTWVSTDKVIITEVAS